MGRNRTVGAASRSASGRLAAKPPIWPLRVGALLATLGLTAAGSLAAMAPAHAAPDDGLAESTLARYEVDGDGPVEVTVTTTIENTKPDSGSYYYYFDSYGIPVPKEADDVVATSRGTELSVSFESSEDPSLSYAIASFGALRYGQEREIVWTYTIPGDPIRSDSYTRVGQGYATFAVVASGDTDHVTIEIVTPTEMTFDSTWDGFTSSDSGKLTTHRSTESQDEYGTSAYVSVRDPDQADTSDVTVGETTLTLSSFPGDAEWSDFVSDQLTEGIPLLEETIGQPWPGGVDTIREDVSPEVFGYAWFDPGRSEIVVPEELDAALLMHELSHAWMNDSSFKGRWLYEGLSEFLGQRVAAETDGEQSPDKAPDRDDPDAVALTGWGEIDHTDGTAEGDTYGYAASYTAITALLGELDEETLADVISAAYQGESAYAGDGDDIENGRTDWRRFLDLLESRAGVTGADDVYRTWVLDRDQQDLLDARSPARESYAAIDEADGGWLPPLVLRTAMSEWTFEDAAAISATLGSDGATLAPDALASTAGDVQTAAEQAELPVPDSVRQAYEDADTAEDLTALETLLPQAVEVVGDVGEASAAAADDGNPLGELGQLMLSVDDSAADSRQSLADGDLDAAGDAAATALDRAEKAPWLGGGVVVLVLAVILGVALLIIRARRRPAPAVATGTWGGAPVGFDPNAGAWPAQAPVAPGTGVPPPWGPSPTTEYPAAPYPGEPTAPPPGWPPPPSAISSPATPSEGGSAPPPGHELPATWSGRADESGAPDHP